jgi:hypothetical protein
MSVIGQSRIFFYLEDPREPIPTADCHPKDSMPLIEHRKFETPDLHIYIKRKKESKLFLTKLFIESTFLSFTQNSPIN